MDAPNNYLGDLRDIKEIMQRSSKFLSLSGLSGISAGIWGLLGAYLVYRNGWLTETGYNFFRFITVATTILILAVLSAGFFTWRKARRQKQGLWDLQAKRMLTNLLIPLVAGGLLCLILLLRGHLFLMLPLTLVFYGLALVNAGKYTLHDIRSLGILEILLGLMASLRLDWALVLWAAGFGWLHIIYGLIMYIKYRS